jgi:hypothetical protein
MPASGGACWHGYPAAGGDAGSTITPMNFMACGANCLLKISGMLNASTMANSYAGYAYLTFNVGQDAGASTNSGVTPKGTGLTPTFSLTPSATTIRFQITGASGMQYCATAVSGTKIMYSDFHVACYNPTPGAAYATSDPITNIGVSLAGGASTTSITLTLSDVKEN